MMMKIDDLYSQKISQLYQKLHSNSINKKKDGKKDKMEISSKAREINNLKAELEKIPEIRKEKVAEIKNALKNNNYQVEPEQVARRILGSIERE
jgi:negative regulator of flagellin synthesis FlgM